MKKVALLSLAVVLLLGLTACGADGSVGTDSEVKPGSVSNEVTSQTEKPETPPEPENIVPEEDVPELLEGVMDVTFADLLSDTSVSVQYDGRCLTVSYDSEKFAELLSMQDKGSQMRIRCLIDGGSYEMQDYYGVPTPGVFTEVLDLDQKPDEGLIEVDSGEDSNYIIRLMATEDLTAVTLRRVIYDENGLMTKGEAVKTVEALPQYEQLSVQMLVPELMPNLMLEYTLTSGETMEYLFAADLSGMKAPVFLMELPKTE